MLRLIEKVWKWPEDFSFSNHLFLWFKPASIHLIMMKLAMHLLFIFPHLNDVNRVSKFKFWQILWLSEIGYFWSKKLFLFVLFFLWDSVPRFFSTLNALIFMKLSILLSFANAPRLFGRIFEFFPGSNFKAPPPFEILFI